MIDEGYTKYRVDWMQSGPLEDPRLPELDRWRRTLFEAGLIGHDSRHDVGFGNISVRTPDGFIISGTQTGHIAETTADHYARVTETDIAGNRVTCEGPVQASSESLTHGAIYASLPGIEAVVHVHDDALWRASFSGIPATPADVAYGTPAMADELARLARNPDFLQDGLAVMLGHEGGLISVGTSLEQASRRMLDYRKRRLP